MLPGGKFKTKTGVKGQGLPTVSGTIRSRRWVLGLLVLHSLHQMQTLCAPKATQTHAETFPCGRGTAAEAQSTLGACPRCMHSH